ncbi:eukaryotic cytochrome b561-domain-containing protein [Ochromonadaceae sp. CCMP2298]|nr:eukaryotic cytochrome b561-domain-containing protein [Ochromonadaceae sp. CCMP2298]
MPYRLLPIPKTLQKYLHALLHTGTIVCISIGISCVVVGNNNPQKNTGGGSAHYANFYSLHSFLGLAAISIYSLNYLLGLMHFLPQCSVVGAAQKSAYMPYHLFLGMFSLFAAVFAVETGLMELLTELGCSYDVTSADLQPVQHYHLLSEGCRLGNGIGVVVLVTVMLASFAIFRFNSAPKSQEEAQTQAFPLSHYHPH